MIGALFLASVAVQDAPKDRVPDAALFDELIRRTNDLKAFSAEYRVRTPELPEELTLRILYRSPGDLRLEMSAGTVMRVQDGSLDLSAAPPKGPASTAHVPYGEWMRERRGRVAQAFHSELPISKQDWASEIECATVLQLMVTPSKTDDKENLQFQCGFQCPREALLSWLDEWKRQDDVRFDGDEHLLRTTQRGTRLRLSTRTGFLDRIEKDKAEGKVVFELKALDLEPELDDAAFALPDPPASAEDISVPFGGRMQGMITQTLRSSVCHWLARHLADKSLDWDEKTRAHVRKVYESIWTDAWALELEMEITKAKKWIDGYGPFLRDAYSKSEPGGESARAEVDEKVQESREKMNGSFEKLVREGSSHLEIPETVDLDESLRSSLLDVEREAMERVFEATVREPLLESFDAMVNRAKGGG